MAFCFFFDIKITVISAATTTARTMQIIMYVPVSGAFSMFGVAVGVGEDVEAVGVGVEAGIGVRVGVEVGVVVGAGVAVGVGVGVGETCTATALDWVEVASKVSVTVAVIV